MYSPGTFGELRANYGVVREMNNRGHMLYRRWE
jgi:hypothetical protein